LRECGNIVVNFFDYFLHAIRKHDEAKAMAVIANLHEPNDTHLGVSRGRPSGRGWGGKQGRMLYDRLRMSAAVRTGSLKDLTDPRRLERNPDRVKLARTSGAGVFSVVVPTLIPSPKTQALSIEETAILNNLISTEPVPAGRTLKLVEAGQPK